MSDPIDDIMQHRPDDAQRLLQWQMKQVGIREPDRACPLCEKPLSDCGCFEGAA